MTRFALISLCYAHWQRYTCLKRLDSCDVAQGAKKQDKPKKIYRLGTEHKSLSSTQVGSEPLKTASNVLIQFLRGAQPGTHWLAQPTMNRSLQLIQVEALSRVSRENNSDHEHQNEV